MYQTGFIAVVGPTNSGKSTLVNNIIGEKVSIISKHPQTTYHGIRGVLTRPDYQIVFTDTPGLQNYREGMARLLNRVAERHAGECDDVIWVFDVTRPNLVDDISKLNKKITEWTRAEKPILVLNKVDLMAKPALLPLLEKLYALNLFSEIIPISAKREKSFARLERLIVSRLPEGPAMYDKSQTTDRSLNFRIGEYIREQVYRATRQELPYTVFVEVEESKEEDEENPQLSPGSPKPAPAKIAPRVPSVHATLNVDSSSRKGILIGKQGNLLKLIGTKARADIEKIMGRQICLKLHVKIKEDWRENKPLVYRYLELDG